MTLNIKKCAFRVTKIEYLGHILTQEGIRPDRVCECSSKWLTLNTDKANSCIRNKIKWPLIRIIGDYTAKNRPRTGGGNAEQR